MQFEHSNDAFVLRLETGEELVETLTKFLAENSIYSGIISGIGAASDITLNYFNMETKEYEDRTFPDDYEILSLTGNISLKDDIPFAHLHITLGTKDFVCIGGHLKSAKVSATCEVVIRKLEAKLDRRLDERTGLYLLDL
ncbi:DNA-binding protein [Patescibacteria group bacterium]|nr:DNA-binding protein [Patescibacteria group bacterium]MBU1911776.1 DNA-binding protein [Patescibacteria group bacterium]